MSKEAVNTDDEMLDLMNELAEIVGHYAYSNTTNLDIHHAVKELRTLILADRKKHELQARIDEINYLNDNYQEDSQDWEREHPGYSTAMIPMEDYINRVKHLKQELEKL